MKHFLSYLCMLAFVFSINAKQPSDVTIDVTLHGDQVEVATHGLKKDTAITCSPAQTTEHRTVTATAPMQKTFAMIKPDAVQAIQTGRIITMIELNKFSISNMHKLQLTKKQAESFYSEHKNKPFFKDLIDYMTSGPVIMMVLEKNNTIEDWRTLIGSTNPAQARPGTLRAMFGTDKVHNAVHGSDSQTSAEREIEFFLNIK